MVIKHPIPGKLYKLVKLPKTNTFTIFGADDFSIKLLRKNDIVLVLSCVFLQEDFCQTGYAAKLTMLFGNNVYKRFCEIDVFSAPNKIFELIP